MFPEKKLFGTLSDGREVYSFTIRDCEGNHAEVINYGAILRSLFIRSSDGSFRDVVLGCDTAQEYEAQTARFGSTMGRCTSRIGGASFVLSGKRYLLSENRSGFHMHGGFEGFDKKYWDYGLSDGKVTFTYLSPDGEEGYPGNLTANVSYSFSAPGRLCIEYDCVSDAGTVINLTNHSYFNLDGFGGESALDQFLTVYSDVIAGIDATTVPDGRIIDISGTALDFTSEHRISERIDSGDEWLKLCSGYDFNYIFDEDGMKKMASMRSESSGIGMDVYSDLYDLGLYTANFLPEIKGKDGIVHHRGDGVCLETQFVPNSVNLPSMKHRPVFEAGRHYRFTTEYSFTL